MVYLNDRVGVRDTIGGYSVVSAIIFATACTCEILQQC